MEGEALRRRKLNSRPWRFPEGFRNFGTSLSRESVILFLNHKILAS